MRINLTFGVLAGNNSITINVSGQNGDGTITEYYYSKDNGSNYVKSTSSSYTNDAFSGFGNATYGACKLVNVANCTGYSNADLSNFPILETLYATGCTSMVTCSLPSSSSLKYCYLPANLRTISLQNKYNVEEIQIEGVSNINSVTMENCNETVQNFIFDKILKPIYG